MKLNEYLHKRVRIILSTNKFVYVGLVISTDKNSLTLIDKNNSKVCLKESVIESIMELSQ